MNQTNKIDFRKKVGAIIVARSGSSRLPKKALMKINGKETLAIVFDRIKNCKNLDSIVFATSSESSDDALVEVARREGISIYRGSLHDVADRFYSAASTYSIDTIVRVTADDLVRDDILIDKAITSHLNGNYDVTMMKNMPYGTASEVFETKILKRIIDNASKPENTGFLEYYLENEIYFRVNYIKANYQFDNRLRLTLDYKEDFILFDRIFNYFNDKVEYFSMEELLHWIKKNSSLLDINSHKTLDYEPSKLDWTLKL